MKNTYSYSRNQRRLEIISITVFLTLTLVHTIHLIQKTDWLHSFPIFKGILLSLLAADFVSGFVHWAADTWGTPEWPIVGQSLIFPFREHHTDQKSITRHDFIETNGNNCLVCLPLLIALFFVQPGFIFTFILGLTTWIFFTNQFHKWSHQDDVSKIITILQRARLILPANHHERHHVSPHTENYCITTGWMNPILNKTRFFARLEKLITRVSGAQPRA